MTQVYKTPPFAKIIRSGEFEAHHHYYEKALNATINPMVSFFLNLGQERILQRYCHLHPKVQQNNLRELLNYQPQFFFWAGADLLNVTSAGGRRQMVVIENNSCPSGQKSMPLLNDHAEQGGYQMLMSQSFRHFLKRKPPKTKGALAVIYDKNPMEASGYASAMADLFNEPVYYVRFDQDESDPPVRFQEGVMMVRDEAGDWKPVRAAFRYLTQRPWNRLPIHGKTRIFNPVLACLAGGRNKMVAAKAYDIFNGELAYSGLHILTPETIWDVSKNEIPIWVNRLGGQAVIKIPYSNAGQGVFTIVNQEELDRFMSQDFAYDRFIVQSLIGNYNWSSTGTRSGKLYHVGTVPSTKGHTYVADLRVMVAATTEGIKPICLYARRAALPLADQLDAGSDSWDILGTNLSIKTPTGWDSDTNRLLLMDRRDFSKLGLGLDDLVEAYIQTVLPMIAIDKMAINLLNSKGRFRMQLFRSFNDDQSLISEIMG